MGWGQFFLCEIWNVLQYSIQQAKLVLGYPPILLSLIFHLFLLSEFGFDGDAAGSTIDTRCRSTLETSHLHYSTYIQSCSVFSIYRDVSQA